MLTRFLITNQFPAACFFTPQGAIHSYTTDRKRITLYYNNGATHDYDITSVPCKPIIEQIPEALFLLHIKMYKNIIKKMITGNMLELIQTKVSPDMSWEEQLENTIISHLGTNLVFPLTLEGILNSDLSQRHYDLPKGEGVYITGSTSSNYNIRTIDNRTLRVQKEHLDIRIPTKKTSETSKWIKHLKEIEDEYYKLKEGK